MESKTSSCHCIYVVDRAPPLNAELHEKSISNLTNSLSREGSSECKASKIISKIGDYCFKISLHIIRKPLHVKHINL